MVLRVNCITLRTIRDAQARAAPLMGATAAAAAGGCTRVAGASRPTCGDPTRRGATRRGRMQQCVIVSASQGWRSSGSGAAEPSHAEYQSAGALAGGDAARLYLPPLSQMRLSAVGVVLPGAGPARAARSAPETGRKDGRAARGEAGTARAELVAAQQARTLPWTHAHARRALSTSRCCYGQIARALAAAAAITGRGGIPRAPFEDRATGIGRPIFPGAPPHAPSDAPEDAATISDPIQRRQLRSVLQPSGAAPSRGRPISRTLQPDSGTALGRVRAAGLRHGRFHGRRVG